MKGKEVIAKLMRGIDELDDDTEYCGTDEFAKKYGYKEATVRQMIRRGKITGVVRLYDRWVIPENADILVKQYTKKNSCVL